MTIRKEVVTLRTVWNWARHSKILKSEFPAMGLKYPKGDEEAAVFAFQGGPETDKADERR